MRSLLLIVTFLLAMFHNGICRTSVEVSETGDPGDIDFKVIVKREAQRDLHQDEYPQLDGRTFKASEPLDPNRPLSQLGDSNQDLSELGQFEATYSIFQPSVDEDTENNDDVEEVDDGVNNIQDRQPEAGTETNSETNADNDKATDVEAKVEYKQNDPSYSAQYPYSETTAGVGQAGSDRRQHTPDDRRQYHGQSQGQHSRGSNAEAQQGVNDDGTQTVVSRRVEVRGRGSDFSATAVPTSGGGYPMSSGSYPSGRDTVTREERRVVLAGRGGTDDSQTSSYSNLDPRRWTNVNQQQQQQQQQQQRQQQQQQRQTGYGRNTYTNNNQQYPSGNQYQTVERRTYTGTSSQGSGYPSTGTEVRGAPYNGPRIVDNNGHYIDENGRHLDSSGRYYDMSGRYGDATVTRTVTYGSAGNTGRTYTDQTGSSYSNNNGVDGGYYRTNQYPSNSRQYVSNTDGSRAVDSYGGTQFYSGSSGYPATYNPIVSQISSDPDCPRINNRVTINGVSCSSAVSEIGSFVCYNYERVSTECCQRCLQVKRSEHVGCEYGDRSSQCRDMNAADCYNERNAQICCRRCREFKEQMRQIAQPGCDYGDRTPRCENMLQRPHLCYLPRNQNVCCSSCPRLANSEEEDCKWGNQSPEFCQPYDSNRRLKVNCYVQQVQTVCCATCKSLSQRMPQQIAGCEYGDAPITFTTGRGIGLDCGEYIRQYGVQECNDHQVSRSCCYTCYRYQNRRQG